MLYGWVIHIQDEIQNAKTVFAELSELSLGRESQPIECRN